jgi:hypothetical protein
MENIMNRVSDIRKRAATADRLAKRMNCNFVLDEEKIKEFILHNLKRELEGKLIITHDKI